MVHLVDTYLLSHKQHPFDYHSFREEDVRILLLDGDHKILLGAEVHVFHAYNSIHGCGFDIPSPFVVVNAVVKENIDIDQMVVEFFDSRGQEISSCLFLVAEEMMNVV